MCTPLIPKRHDDIYDYLADITLQRVGSSMVYRYSQVARHLPCPVIVDYVPELDECIYELMEQHIIAGYALRFVKKITQANKFDVVTTAYNLHIVMAVNPTISQSLERSIGRIPLPERKKLVAPKKAALEVCE